MEILYSSYFIRQANNKSVHIEEVDIFSNDEKLRKNIQRFQGELAKVASG